MNEIVKYNNELNKISFTGFTKTHMDLFMAICSKISTVKGNRIRIRTKELKQIIRFEKGGNRDFFDELDAMTDQLQKINGKAVDRTAGNRKFIKFVFFTVFEYIENDEWLDVEVNERFAWLLTEFEKYTTFELAEFIELKSKYTKNLYRLLKQWRTVGKYVFNDIAEFRELMDIPINYSNKRMMDNCVSVAVKEISELDQSFKGFKCEPVYARKRGKPLDKLMFTWQAEQISWQMPVDDQKSSDDDSSNCPPSQPPTKQKTKKSSKFQQYNSYPQRQYTAEELDDLESKLLGIHRKNASGT